MVDQVSLVREELPSDPRSVRAARTVVRDALRSWGLLELEDVATLLVSELATNALLHARTQFAVEVLRRPGRVRIRLLDCSPAGPAPRRASPEAGTGRGLGLVAALSASWGHDDEVQPWTKAVWFELRG